MAVLERAKGRRKGEVEKNERGNEVRRRCTLRNEIIFPPECTQWNSTVTQPEKGDCTLNRLWWRRRQQRRRRRGATARSLLGVERRVAEFQLRWNLQRVSKIRLRSANCDTAEIRRKLSTFSIRRDVC